MEVSALFGTGRKILRNRDLKYKLQGEIYLLEGIRFGMGFRYGIQNGMALAFSKVPTEIPKNMPHNRDLDELTPPIWMPRAEFSRGSDNVATYLFPD